MKRVKHLIGRKVVCSDFLNEIEDYPEQCEAGILKSVYDDVFCPFSVKGIVGSVQFIREIMEDKMIELKPCPFCGGKASLRRALYGFFIICDCCLCETLLCATDDEVIEVWNKRVEASK